MACPSGEGTETNREPLHVGADAAQSRNGALAANQLRARHASQGRDRA